MPEDILVKSNEGGGRVAFNRENMVTIYGTLLGIEVGRGEISLLFGSRTVRTGPREECLMVSDRIVLNPYAAKRLMILLQSLMASHEVRFPCTSPIMETSN